MFNLSFLKKTDTKIVNSYINILGKEIKLIVGLGNPGDEYKNTFHNVGFIFLDTILENTIGEENEEAQSWKSEKLFRYTKLENVILAKPRTFMNNSGNSVKEMTKKFGIKEDEVLIVHDDSDIGLGSYKFGYKKGSAGHKGVKSIQQVLKTNSFSRLRIGIRKENGRAEKFVLNKINKNELDKLKNIFSEIKAIYFKL